MNLLKLISIIAIIFFIGCSGNKGSSDTTTSSIELSTALKSNQYFAVENSANKQSLYKITFDSNVTTWSIDTYDNNYSAQIASTIESNITVSTNSIKTSALEYIQTLNDAGIRYFTTTFSPLIHLKFFEDKDNAINYANTSLKDELKSKKMYIVRNDLNQRTLFHVDINELVTQWDVFAYDSNYSNVSGSQYGLNISVNDRNFSDSSGTLYLNTKEKDYIQLISTSNSDLILKLYEDEAIALDYFNSFDLRKSLVSKKFYTVGNNENVKQLYTFEVNSALDTWNFSKYENDFNTTATLNGQNGITIKEDRLIEENGDTLLVKSYNDSYIELNSISNINNTYRLYIEPDKALYYFNQYFSHVVLETTQGNIEIDLFPDIAPLAVRNFTTHIENGYYDGIAFHRVIKDFMIQGGDPTETGGGGESIWGEAFEDEFKDKVFDKPGVVAMANAGPGTNGSQFFITTTPTPWLNDKHTIFGQITSDSFETLEKLNTISTDVSDRPIERQEIIKAYVDINSSIHL